MCDIVARAVDWHKLSDVAICASPHPRHDPGMRMLGRTPGFAAAAILTLAAGIAAGVTMFAVYWNVVLDPVRLPDPDRVVSIARVKRDPQVPTDLSWPRVEGIRREATSFAAIGAYSNESVSLSGTGTPPRELRGLRVSAGFFDALRVVPAHGRLLTADDDVPNGPAVCGLSPPAGATVFGGAGVGGGPGPGFGGGAGGGGGRGPPPAP